MTTSQQNFFKIQREQSEIRSRLGEIRATPEDKITPELRTERGHARRAFQHGRNRVPDGA